MAAPGGAMPMPMGPGGQQPTPEQIQQMQRQLAEDAAKNGMSVPQFIEHLKAQAMREHQMRQQQAQQQGAQGQHQHQQQQTTQETPIQPGPPSPEGLAVAKWLRAQDLKTRQSVLNGQRKDMFKVKRAIRALQSDAYQKARKKNPLLPPVEDRATAEKAFMLLPLSMLALRVSKIDPSEGHEGHAHAKTKRVKGLWTVKIEPQQAPNDEFHYIWLYEGAQWKQKVYAVLALVGILTLVMFPLWPLVMRQGVWYLSMGAVGLIGLFFGMAIVRLIGYLITAVAVPPGIWLYPNLFEDVGFFDSFRPLWGWHEDPKTAAKRLKQEKKEKKLAKAAKKVGSTDADGTAGVESTGPSEEISAPITTDATTTGAEAAPSSNSTSELRSLSARVEEVEDE